MASKLDRLWADYEEHHRTAGNKWCHLVGIPLILVGLLSLLSVPVFRVERLPVEVALLLVVVTGGLYLWLDAKLGAAMFAATLLIYLGARLLAWPVALGLFVVGWGFQFVGHGVYEKRSPAFFTNLAHLLVGPLWVLNHALRIRSEQPGSHRG
ncbi:MAG: Mpo1-like protein [Terriglobia bacterium]